MTHELILASVPLVGGLLTWVINRYLGKKLGMEINQTQVEAALNWLIDRITTREQLMPGATGQSKQDGVISDAIALMPAAMQDVLIQRYGGLQQATEAAFQRSHLAAGGTTVTIKPVQGASAEINHG